MAPGFRSFLKRWAVTAFAVMVVAWIMPGVNFDAPVDLVAASLLLGVLNASLKRILNWIAPVFRGCLLGLPVLFFNAIIFRFVGVVIPGFEVQSWWAAFWAGVLVSIISVAVNVLFLGGGHSRLEMRWQRRSPAGRRQADTGSGPVIDI